MTTAASPRLQDLVQRSSDSEKAKSFFVRLAGQGGSVLLMYAPDDWVQFDTSALNPGGNLSRLVWLRIPKDEERDFTVAAMRLPDGSVLQVGRCTTTARSCSSRFAATF